MTFERLIVPDLLGPADGPDETIPTQPVPRDRYLVGLLAPKQSYVSPSRFDAATAADSSGATSEDHVASPPHLIPSALGLTFVPGGTTALVVDASWGHYARETVADDADKSIRVWRRSPCGTLHIALPAVDGSLETQTPTRSTSQSATASRFTPSPRPASRRAPHISKCAQCRTTTSREPIHRRPTRLLLADVALDMRTLANAGRRLLVQATSSRRRRRAI